MGIGNKAGKIWGETSLIEANGVLEFHRIQMEKGGVCSKHLHSFKWNGFYVEAGYYASSCLAERL